jgi:hypothetical protein
MRARRMLIFIILLFPWVARADLRQDVLNSSLAFFIEQANPTTGLVRDTADNFGPTSTSNRIASMASTGFGLAVLAHAAQTGRLDRELARALILKTLLFARDHVSRYHGFFLHFVDWETGGRLWNCEYSTIDTALFIAGALYAAQVFPGTDLSAAANQLYADVDFTDFMTDGGHHPAKRTLSLSYTPEAGYATYQWSIYAEQMILLVLGLGSPTHALPPEVWTTWIRQTQRMPDGNDVMGFNMPLFVHQYSLVFLDLRAFNDGFPNYFENGRKVTTYQRSLAKSDQHFQTFREGFWGLSAGESPTGYSVADPTSYSSTVCVACVLGSAMFDESTITTDATFWRNSIYAVKIWGRYGFADSIDLDHTWFSHDVLGITVGTEYLSFANTDSATSVWQTFMRIPEVQSALARTKKP